MPADAPACMLIQNNKLFESLKAKALSISQKNEDQVISVVYADAKKQHNIVTGIVTMGELVVPGKTTVRDYPKTGSHPFHFRKTFTPASPPIIRGETPEIEFGKTRRIHQIMPGKVPEPLGFDALTYRSEAVCGQTLHASSPFSDLSYEDALALEMDAKDLTQHAEGVLAVCKLLEDFHSHGIVHDDMTTQNAMLYLNNKEFQAILIDMASSCSLNEIPPEKRAETIASDFSELYRELVLAQFHLGLMESAHAQKSIQSIDDLFPADVSSKLTKIRPHLGDFS